MQLPIAELHEHYCVLYSDQNSLAQSFVPALQTGLLDGDRCAYFYDENDEHFVTGALGANGFDVAPYIASGALVMISTKDAHLKDGYFARQKMLDCWWQLVAQSQAMGYRRVRAAVEMTWALSQMPGCDMLVSFEAGLNNLVDDMNVQILCMYNTHKFDSETIRGTICAHPLLIDKGLSSINDQYSLRVVSDLVADQIDMVCAPFKLGELLEEICAQFAPDALAQHSVIRCTVGAICRKLEVVGDAFALRQVLSILVDNAVKATGTGHVDLSFGIHAKVPGELIVRFTVSDSGCGLTAEQFKHVHELLDPVEHTATVSYGRGGLTLAAHYVRIMGGHLLFCSTEGAGASFSFAIPLEAISVD